MIGKTKQDMLSGAKLRNYNNKRLRAAWQEEWGGKMASKEAMLAFPSHTCNGKKNRYRTTGKNGTTVFNKDVKH